MLGILSVVASLALGAQPAASATGDVDAVIELVKSGASESLVVKTIQKGGKSYSLTPADVMRLRSAGVSNTIIEAMLETAPAPKASKPSSKASGGTASTARSSPGDREPTEADLAAALKAGADAGNERMKDLEAKCKSGAYRSGNDQALALLCLGNAMGTGGKGGIRRDITGFRKVACSRASGRPGWNCDYAIREKMSGVNVGPTLGGMMNEPTVQHGRFVYIDNRWVLIE
jgi:hypothetical protein